MPSKKWLAVILAITALCGCSNTDTDKNRETPIANADFEFSILKIGKADAVIMKTENHSVIIDCGEEDDGAEILDYLSDNGIKSVDYLLISHFDQDHVGGAPQIIENIDIGQIITPDYEGTCDEYESYRNKIAEKNISPLKLTETMTFTLDGAEFTVYPPLQTSYEESDNDFSLAVSVTHGNNSFLFTGDAESERTKEIVTQTNQTYDFLKVPHHGEFDKNTKPFVLAVRPEYSVITCSNKNPADKQTVDVLTNVGSAVYYTKDGDILVKSNGNEISVSQED